MEEGSPLTIRISSILFLLVPVFLLASCSDHNGTSTYREHEVNDDAYVMVKGTDLYIKELERDIEKVDSGIREDSFHYRDDHHGLIYINEEDNLYSYKEGKKKKLAEQVSTSRIPYQVSFDERSLAYLTGENNQLYVMFNEEKKEKVRSGIVQYRLSSDGKHLFYTNDERDLYVYSDEAGEEKIASNVVNFQESEDGTKLLIGTEEGQLFSRDLKETENVEIHADGSIYGAFQIDNDGDFSYLADYQGDIGELYCKSDNHEVMRIASDVVDFERNDDSYVYLNGNEQLFLKKIGEHQSKVIAESVLDFFLLNDIIYYLDEAQAMYKVTYAGHPQKIADKVTVDANGRLCWSIVDDQIIYLADDSSLFLAGKKVADDVTDFVSYVDHVVYTTKDGQIKSFSTSDTAHQQAFRYANTYTKIYYGNQLVFSKTLSLDDIDGIWGVQGTEEEILDGYGEEYGPYFFEIRTGADHNSGFLVMYDEEEEMVIELNIADSDSEYIRVNTDVEDVSFMFKKVSEQDLDFIFDGDETDPLLLYKSSVEELKLYYQPYELAYF